jgi:hypothetical protein
MEDLPNSQWKSRAFGPIRIRAVEWGVSLAHCDHHIEHMGQTTVQTNTLARFFGRT